MEKQVKAYLEGDRQWPRTHRIAHAKFNLKLSKDINAIAAIEFWEAVIHANVD